MENVTHIKEASIFGEDMELLQTCPTSSKEATANRAWRQALDQGSPVQVLCSGFGWNFKVGLDGRIFDDMKPKKQKRSKAVKPAVDRVEVSRESSHEAVLLAAGSRIAVTGGHSRLTRAELFEVLREMGFDPSEKFPKNTAVLLSARTDTSKAEKAREMGVQVIPLEEFGCLQVASEVL